MYYWHPPPDSRKKGLGRTEGNAWRMEHSVRPTLPGVLYLIELVALTAAAAKTICQGERRSTPSTIIPCDDLKRNV